MKTPSPIKSTTISDIPPIEYTQQPTSTPDDTITGTKNKIVDMQPLLDSQTRANQILEEHSRLLTRILSDGISVQRA